MIIYSQKVQYENLVANGFEKWPNFRDLMIIAKELKFKQMLDENAIASYLLQFCAEKSEGTSEEVCKNLVGKCIERLKITENYTELPEKIAFFSEECVEISKITNKRWQKLVYILCCLSKLKKSDGIYLNSSNSMKLSDVFELADIKMPKKDQEMELHKMKEAGLISVDMKPMCKFHPSCLRLEGSLVAEFEPSSKMLKELYNFNGSPMFACEKCGKMSPKTNNRCHFCKECAAEIRRNKLTEQQRERRLRLRTL